MRERTITFAPNISWLFPELPFRERPSAAARAGFKAIEFGFPSKSDLDALASARQELGLQIVLFNLDVPVWDAKNRGYLVDPARRDEFHRKLDESLEIARRLEVLKVMLPVGVEVDGMRPEAQAECMLENLRFAAPLAAQAGVLLTLEMLNPIDNPGYFLTSSQAAVELIKLVNHPNVKFQFDTYHIQLMEGNLANNLRKNINWIGHIQFADAPDRHEPGTGEINFNYLLRILKEAGYEEYIGLEYRPLGYGAEALDWVPPEMRISTHPVQ